MSDLQFSFRFWSFNTIISPFLLSKPLLWHVLYLLSPHLDYLYITKCFSPFPPYQVLSSLTKPYQIPSYLPSYHVIKSLRKNLYGKISIVTCLYVTSIRIKKEQLRLSSKSQLFLTFLHLLGPDTSYPRGMDPFTQIAPEKFQKARKRD